MQAVTAVTPLRMAVIYFGSEMAGNLASAIFIPHRAEAGPAGAQFGILACLVVEVVNVWPILREPRWGAIVSNDRESKINVVRGK